MSRLALGAITATALLTCAVSAQARLICGVTQMRHYGIQDQSFALARHWLVFPSTTPHPGAVVVFSRGRDGVHGHVARIVSVEENQCEAIVSDDRGTYRRNICKKQIGVVQPVDPGGNASTSYSARSHVRHHYSRRHYAHHRHRHHPWS